MARAMERGKFGLTLANLLHVFRGRIKGGGEEHEMLAEEGREAIALQRRQKTIVSSTTFGVK